MKLNSYNAGFGPRLFLRLQSLRHPCDSYFEIQSLGFVSVDRFKVRARD